MRSRPILARFAMLSLAGAAVLSTATATIFAQSDVPRRTIAITYPLDETVLVKFRGTTLLPRLKGEAKVKRAGRRGTRVELAIDNLPRANELGGIYTTFVLWAISPSGSVDNLGEIKRGGSQFIASKLERHHSASDLCFDRNCRTPLPYESTEPDGGFGKYCSAAAGEQPDRDGQCSVHRKLERLF